MVSSFEQLKAMTTRERNEDLLKGIEPITERIPGKFAVGETVTILGIFGQLWKQATVLEIPMEGWRILNTVDDDWVVRKVVDLTNAGNSPE